MGLAQHDIPLCILNTPYYMICEQVNCRINRGFHISLPRSRHRWKWQTHPSLKMRLQPFSAKLKEDWFLKKRGREEWPTFLNFLIPPSLSAQPEKPAVEWFIAWISLPVKLWTSFVGWHAVYYATRQWSDAVAVWRETCGLCWHQKGKAVIAWEKEWRKSYPVSPCLSNSVAKLWSERAAMPRHMTLT